MSWETIVKDNNLGVSVVNVFSLQENTRIDPEYYLPEYLIPYRKGLHCTPIGSILTKCQYGISQEMNESGIGVEIYRMNELINGLCKNVDLKFADINEATKKLYKLKENDILFNRVNSIEFVGRTAIYKHKDKNRVFASYLIRINTDEKVILPDYLNVFLNCKYGKKELKRKARWSVNQANINAEELKRIILPVASMSFQEEIKSISNEMSSLVNGSQEMYVQAELMLLKELGLVKHIKSNLSVSVRNLDECLRHDRFDAEYWQPEYDAMEKAVSKVTQRELGEVVSISKGVEVGSEAYDPEGKSFIRVSDFSIYGIEDVEKKISPELYEELKDKFTPKKGEVLFTKDGTIGLSYALHDDTVGILSSAFLRLKPTIKINTDYLALVLNSLYCKTQIERMSGGAIIAHLKPESAKKIKIPLLSDTKQAEIAGKVSTAFRMRKEAQELFSKAKRAVEIFIEEDEKQAISFILSKANLY